MRLTYHRRFTTDKISGTSGGGDLVVAPAVSSLHNDGVRNRERILQNPDKPWLWRDDWAQGYARPEWRGSAGLMALVGIVCELISVPIVMNVERVLVPNHTLRLAIVLIFPVIGLLLIGQSLLAYCRGRKFQQFRFNLSAIPCVLGGKLQGRVDVEFVFPPDATVAIKLSCVRSYVSGTGDNRTRWEKILWQDKKTLAVSTDGRTSYIPIEFTIPYDARETDTRNPSDEIIWRLTTNSTLPGFDFAATFTLPVFKTQASNPSITTARIEADDEKHIGDTQPANSKIVTTTSSHGGPLFYFGRARNKRVATIITSFGALFTATGLFFGIAAGRSFSWIIGLVPLILSGGIGLLLLAIGIWMWLGTTSVEVLNRELHIRSTFLGIARSRVIAASSIQGFQLDSNLQAGEEVWYDLKLNLDNGRSVTAGSGLEKNEAEWLRSELKKDLGISSSPVN